MHLAYDRGHVAAAQDAIEARPTLEQAIEAAQATIVASLDADDVETQLQGMPSECIALLIKTSGTDEQIGRLVRAVVAAYVERVAYSRETGKTLANAMTADQAALAVMAGPR